MLEISRLMCFCATKCADAAKDFYQRVLGLKLIEDSPFALVFDANGTMLRIQKVPDHVPAKHTVLGWKVDDIRSRIGELSAKGVRFERFDGIPQDDCGIWSTPDRVLVAWFKDPDGNTLSLTQWPM